MRLVFLRGADVMENEKENKINVEGFEFSTSEIGEAKYIISMDEDKDKIANRRIRLGVSFVMTLLVFIMNIAVVAMIYRIAMAELDLIGQKLLPAESRQVTTTIYGALIAGTVAEVAGIMYVIVKYIFRSDVSGADQSS